MKILVVDDEQSVGMMLNVFLQTLFLQSANGTTVSVSVSVAPSGLEAWNLIQEEKFDLVISDIRMPEMSGLELLEKAKIHDGITQFVMITGYVDQGAILEAFRLGANNVIFKPFTSLDLLGEEVKIAQQRIDRINLLLKQRKGIAA